MMQADGTHATTLLRTDSQEEESPSWSPDGLHLVFSSLSAGNNPHIYRMEVERPAPVRLTDIPPDEDALFPAWSPDGKRIAFVSSHAEGADIYVMQADGSNPTRLTDNGANNMFPAWSPDGKFLLFTSDQAGTTEVYVMGADGSNPIRLSSSGGITAFPAWSPDGNTIAYMSNMDIYLMNRDGSNQRELVSNDTWVWGITWSPDSTYLAFAAMKGDNYDIYMHALDGSVQVNLTESAANEMFPSWAP
jgi:tol-pal system beta propeller repeat protein TolB